MCYGYPCWMNQGNLRNIFAYHFFTNSVLWVTLESPDLLLGCDLLNIYSQYPNFPYSQYPNFPFSSENKRFNIVETIAIHEQTVIRITRPCNLHPLNPTFIYVQSSVVKLGFTGVYVIFLLFSLL